MPGTPSNLVRRAKIQTPAARRAGDGEFGESEIESPRAANMDGAENESAVGDERMNAADRFLSGLASEDRVEVESDLSETTEEASVQSTSSDDRDGGDAAFEEPVEESAQYFINMASTVMHSCRSPGLFKCGRKITKAYSPVYELQGIRCSRCFNV